MRPFWRYYGGKWRAAPQYPPPLDGRPIVEPFAGAAGYATRYGAGRDVILVDRSPVIVAIWSWLIRATPADVLSIPDIPDGGTVDDVDAPQAVRWLMGFWVNGGTASPRKRPSTWAKLGQDVHNWSGWGRRDRQRIAKQVPAIKNWSAVLGSYDDCPDIRATWFVDPPYQTPAGRHYPCDFRRHAALGEWCDTRRGMVIACDQQGADWRPWNWSSSLKGTRGASQEVAWIHGVSQLSLLDTE